MHLARRLLILCFCLLISACDYVTPFYQMNTAMKYDEMERYKDAIPHYQNAIAGFQKVEHYGGVEYFTRIIYSVALDSYAEKNDDYKTYVTEARNNYIRLLETSDQFNNNDILKSLDMDISRGVYLNHIARTYMYDAQNQDDDDKYYDLVQQAYLKYKEASELLEKQKDWENLAVTYYSLGESSDWYGDYETAISWLEMAVELDEKHGFDSSLEEDKAYLEKLKLKLKEEKNTT